MIRGLVLVVVLMVVSWTLPVVAEEAAAPEKKDDGKVNLLVFDLEAEEGLKDLAKQLTDELLLHLGKQEKVVVSGQSEISVMLAHEKDKKLLMCKDDRSCLAQISSALSAEKAIVGRVGKLGDAFVVTLKLTDTKTVSVESAESISSDDIKELPELTRMAAMRLLGLAEGGSAKKFKLTIAEEGASFAVLDLSNHGVTPATVASLTDLLSLELKKFEGLSVVSRSEIEAMLQYQADKMVLQCKSDTSCLIEIGGALGVDYLVSGGVGTLGSSLVVNLKLLNIHEAQVTNRVSETFEGDESELVRALRFAVKSLLGHIDTGEGELTVVSNVSKGMLVLDGQTEIEYPLKQPIPHLLVGKHGLDFKSDGYYSLYKEGYVEPESMSQLRFELTALPVPWYKKWWVWTAVGVVVAGGVGTGLYFGLNQEPTTGSVTVNID
jgi:TolB-like protein